MKKAILGLAFLTIASFSIPAMAQKQDENNCKSKTECAAKDPQCCKCDRKCTDPCRSACCQKRVMPNLFDGIELTAKQKESIKALDNSTKAARLELRTKAKAAREKKDTTYNPRIASKEIRSKYINELGNILSSDQMMVYLKNYYINGSSLNNGRKAFVMKQGKHRHHDKGFRHAQRHMMKDTNK